MVLLLLVRDITAARDRNVLLEAAGFVAACHRDEPLDAPDQVTLRYAVDVMLRAMEPNGAVAVDRAWNVLQMNGAAAAPHGRLRRLRSERAAGGDDERRPSVLHPAGFGPRS